MGFSIKIHNKIKLIINKIFKNIQCNKIISYEIVVGEKMRKTRYVMLPVKSWQYIGLLVVSLACLTLGLVSRDREGHAGNLAGPELKHEAPHE